MLFFPLYFNIKLNITKKIAQDPLFLFLHFLNGTCLNSYSEEFHKYLMTLGTSNKLKCIISLVFLIKNVIFIISHYLLILNGNLS